jgi:beta-lactamase superfamily II metal-dependent hydrolase
VHFSSAVQGKDKIVRLQIFDVEHGACALLTADNNTRMMIDCGHNASTGWRPGTYLARQGIFNLDMLGITNYDEDHASGSADLFDKVNVAWLLRNRSVSGATIKTLKAEDGMGPGIDRLVYAIDHVFHGGGAPTVPEPEFCGATRQIFFNQFPQFDDENNLSLVIFLKCHGVGVMFPGDLEKRGFLELLKNEAFKQALRETNIYVASHHGRENGCCDEIAAELRNVYYVVISDKVYQHETQETIPFYSRVAKGGPFRQEQIRKVLTTRCDGRIDFEFGPGTWGPR